MMNKVRYYPKKIFVEKSSLEFPAAERVLENSGAVPFEIIDSVSEAIEEVRASKDPIGEGKKYLLLLKQKGEFVKPCPCTPHYTGCNYFIINLDQNCPLNCTYCILQGYLSNPLITVSVNREDLWRELDRFLTKKKGRVLRIGTGELSDSLALDHITGSSRDFVSYFREKRNVFFEFKTKTANVNHLLEEAPPENVVVAWSLNSQKMIQEEEKGAPSLEERLDAAQRISQKGYRVAFHFDPIIYYPGWEEDYCQAADELFAKVSPEKIVWISMGSLRFPPSLKPVIQERFPYSQIVYEELIKGKDGKLRYFKPIRMKLYKTLVKHLRKAGGEGIPLYFCMESEEVWEKILQIKIKGKESVERLLSLPFRLSL